MVTGVTIAFFILYISGTDYGNSLSRLIKLKHKLKPYNVDFQKLFRLWFRAVRYRIVLPLQGQASSDAFEMDIVGG